MDCLIEEQYPLKKNGRRKDMPDVFSQYGMENLKVNQCFPFDNNEHILRVKKVENDVLYVQGKEKLNLFICLKIKLNYYYLFVLFAEYFV